MSLRHWRTCHCLRVMSEHPDNKVLQTYGLRVLMSAMHRNKELKIAVGKVNGTQTVLTAMKRFYTHQDVVFFAFKALKSLCYLTANSELLVCHLGAVPFLLDTMKRFAVDPSITEAACDLFYELCECDRYLRKPILAANAASTLAAAFEHFRGNSKIKRAALDALNILTSV